MVNEIIGKISRGSKMDQIYIPKNRIGFVQGEYVVIQPLGERVQTEKNKLKKEGLNLNFYGLKDIEPLKMRIIESIIETINRKMNPDNIIFTGSFLDGGFRFNDIDILLISEKGLQSDIIKKDIEDLSGIKTHILNMSNKTLSSGLSIDPLYTLMLSKCVSLNKMIFNVKRNVNYKLLDINLLKSKSLIENFSILNGDEKYYLTLNMISILLFMQYKKLSKEIVEREIERVFNIGISELKGNTMQESFIKKYEEIFNKTFSLILDNIKKERKNEQE